MYLCDFYSVLLVCAELLIKMMFVFKKTTAKSP